MQNLLFAGYVNYTVFVDFTQFNIFTAKSYWPKCQPLFNPFPRPVGEILVV